MKDQIKKRKEFNKKTIEFIKKYDIETVHYKNHINSFAGQMIDTGYKTVTLILIPKLEETKK